MKKMMLVLILILATSGFVLADVPHGFKWEQTDLVISVSAPPALAFVENSSGQRAGADYSSSTNANGTQGNGLDSGLTEIPKSHVWQQNDSTYDNNDYTNNSYTLWNINIYDSAPQTYTINLEGIASGTVTVNVSGLSRAKGTKPVESDLNVLINNGQIRQISLAYNPTSKTLSTTPIVTNDDLLNDIKSACAQNLIAHRECDFLEDKAERIQKALDHHRYEEAKDLIKSFLCNLGELKSDKDDDRDCHGFIKELALTILIDDAKALLKTIPRKDRDDDDRDHH